MTSSMTAMDSEGVALDEASILADARRAAGLEAFDDESFLPPLRALLHALQDEARLTPAGRASQRARIVGLLVNRLRAADAFRRHPEILDEEIRAPLVVVGLPRTGTTMLHRMLASDRRAHALYWWESRNPAPLPGRAPDASGRDPRIADAEAEVAAMLEAAPELASIHPLEAEAPDEEIMLLEHSFYSDNSEAFAWLPSFGAWLESHDHAPGYATLLRLLQLLQWQKRRRGERAERWVLKAPAHLGHMDLLFRTLPDARVIQTHRDPVETIPSLASFIFAILRMGSLHVEKRAVGPHWSRKMRRALEACMLSRERWGERFFDVGYRDAAREPMAQIEQIYDFAGLTLPADQRQRMEQWAVDNERDKRAAHEYTLEEYGLCEAGIATDFKTYRDRFIV